MSRVLEDVRHAEQREHREIDQDDRPEQSAHLCRPARLDEEQADQDDDRGGNDERREAGVDRLQSLDRGQDRDRRGDHRVAVEQAGGEHAEHDQGRGPFLAFEVARDQRQQRERAAFALVVGAHRDQHIFDRDDQHQRPEDQAQHAEDVQPVDRQRMRAEEAFLHRVERRGADIAVNDADRAEHQPGQRFLRAVMRRRLIGRKQIV